MSKAPKARNVSPDLQTVGGRVRHLLKELWGGNQTNMARDVQCSQSALSQVEHGAEPGKRLLSLITSCGRVNPEWLFHGKGDPASINVGNREHLNSILPISRIPLPGSPIDFRDLLTGDFAEAAPQLVTESRYYLVVQNDDCIARTVEMNVAVGDHILVETDRNCFPALEQFYEQLCVIRITSRSGTRCCLALVDYVQGRIEDGPSHLQADNFEHLRNDPSIISEQFTVQFRGKSRNMVKKYRLVSSGSDPVLEKVPVTDLELEPTLLEITMQDIVGICLSLRRSL